METRRDFIKKTAMLSGGAALLNTLPPSIQKALAINPAEGSTWKDAEHVVILMQENRSFDHCFGTLKGVRGFNDPRTIRLPSNNRVWLQADEQKKVYAPFRYDLKDSKITWMSALPHSWEDQVDARNKGKHDRWLEVKKSGNDEYKEMPLTMGYYTREDIPFYYALADAFTVCDQNFCSSLTGTTPNRLYFWTGTIREKPEINAKANVRNSDVDYGKWVSWKTFPERLEENNISWKIYQNELSLNTGLEGEAEEWLANFTDNPLEWFTQYNVRFTPGYIPFLKKQKVHNEKLLESAKEKLGEATTAEEKIQLENQISKSEEMLNAIAAEMPKWNKEEFGKLSAREKSLHARALCTNVNDPHYHELEEYKYVDNGEERTINIPKGDVLHQFRSDVKEGKLPQISWLVAPARFSDHPGSPWYGVWYLSECIDILTQNPDVWKKTIFILAYDENDGYFDHVPPFVAPDPRFPGTGKTSKNIDGSVEQVTVEQEREHANQSGSTNADSELRTGPIGLGFRVPLVVASPWSRGGAVCSQVFDHTSVLQFLEKFASIKASKSIMEENISAWRRTVCGDLTSVFAPYNGESVSTPLSVKKNEHVELITNAQFKNLPTGFRALSAEEIAEINNSPSTSSRMPKQEKGIKPSRALPYQLYVEGKLSDDKKQINLHFSAGKEVFHNSSAGAPFLVYATGNWKDVKGLHTPVSGMRTWNYAVSAGDKLNDSWSVDDFDKGIYRLEVYGPNGFYRAIAGNENDPQLDILCEYEHSGRLKKQLSGNIELKMQNKSNRDITITITDNAYGAATLQKILPKYVKKDQYEFLIIQLGKNFGWYDFTISVSGNDVFERRYAGHVETGKESFTDPLMGGIVN